MISEAVFSQDKAQHAVCSDRVAAGRSTIRPSIASQHNARRQMHQARIDIAHDQRAEQLLQRMALLASPQRTRSGRWLIARR